MIYRGVKHLAVLAVLAAALAGGASAASDIVVKNDTGIFTLLGAAIGAPGSDVKETAMVVESGASGKIAGTDVGVARVVFNLGMNNVRVVFDNVALSDADTVAVRLDDNDNPVLEVSAGDNALRSVPGKLTSENLSGLEKNAKAATCKWSVEAAYPDLGVESVDAKLKEWLDRYVADRMNEAKEMFDADMTKNSWSMWVGYTTSSPSDKVASVIFEAYEYPYRAAHPTGRTVVKNYLLASGEELTLDSLFRDPGKALAVFAEHAQPLIRDELRRDAARDFPEDLNDPVWFKEGLSPTRENYDALSLEPNGVRVHFQQYQILPYAFGMPGPLIPLSLLEPAGPNPEVWPAK